MPMPAHRHAARATSAQVVSLAHFRLAFVVAQLPGLPGTTHPVLDHVLDRFRRSAIPARHHADLPHHVADPAQLHVLLPHEVVVREFRTPVIDSLRGASTTAPADPRRARGSRRTCDASPAGARPPRPAPRRRKTSRNIHSIQSGAPQVRVQQERDAHQHRQHVDGAQGPASSPAGSARPSASASCKRAPSPPVPTHAASRATTVAIAARRSACARTGGDSRGGIPAPRTTSGTGEPAWSQAGRRPVGATRADRAGAAPGCRRRPTASAAGCRRRDAHPATARPGNTGRPARCLRRRRSRGRPTMPTGRGNGWRCTGLRAGIGGRAMGRAMSTSLRRRQRHYLACASSCSNCVLRHRPP